MCRASVYGTARQDVVSSVYRTADRTCLGQNTVQPLRYSGTRHVAAGDGGTVILCQQNVRSLVPKIDEVRELLRTAVLCLTETHLSDSIDDLALYLSGCTVTRSDRRSGAGGGVAVVARDDLGVEPIGVERHQLSSSRLESI